MKTTRAITQSKGRKRQPLPDGQEQLCRHGIPPLMCHLCNPPDNIPAATATPTGRAEAGAKTLPPAAGTLTLSEKLMETARLIGKSAFSKETLIVQAWQRWPQEFGLPGYRPQYPDSNRVATVLY